MPVLCPARCLVPKQIGPFRERGNQHDCFGSETGRVQTEDEYRLDLPFQTAEFHFAPAGNHSDRDDGRSHAHHSARDKGPDSESSSSDDNVPLSSRYRTSRSAMASTPTPLATVLPTSSEKVTRSRGTGQVPPPSIPLGDARVIRERADPSTPNFDWVREDVLSFSSSMDSTDSIRHLFTNYRVIFEAWFDKIRLLPCKEDERPFMQSTPGGSPFFYFYRDLVLMLGGIIPPI